MNIPVLDTLSEREKEVIRLRFGFNDGQALTIEETGRALGLSRERVRQIEAKTLSKLRHPSRLVPLRRQFAVIARLLLATEGNVSWTTPREDR